ncbi:MAG: cob(I)yrinic acid a,c-diamide adenosyltransferase [Acidobacteriota bacterium]
MARIYTRGGDAGSTGLYDGSRVSKDHPRVAFTGELDELNALLGLAGGLLPGDVGDLPSELMALQRDLFALGALVADPRRDDETDESAVDERLRLGATRVEELERIIDRWEEELAPLTAFILPGGHPAAGTLHAARAVARRAERSLVALELPHLIERAGPYLTRLSDLLFVAARVANARAGLSDVTW